MKRYRLPTSVGLIGFLLLIPSILLNIYLFSRVQTPEKGIRVIEVLDGDTLLLAQKVRLRLRHVDAPETKFCGGIQAKKLLTKLVKDKEIRIEEEIRDQFGRPLALVYVGDVLINQKMLESGWGRFHHDQTSASDTLKEVAEETKKEEKGLYGLCIKTENTENPKCWIKGNIDRKNKKYYLPNCAQYKFTVIEKDMGEDFFCSEKEAQEAGFTKAATCR